MAAKKSGRGRKPAKGAKGRLSKAEREKAKAKFVQKLERLPPDASFAVLKRINKALKSRKPSGWGKEKKHMAQVPYLVDFLAKAQFTPEEMKIYHAAVNAGRVHLDAVSRERRQLEHARQRAKNEHLLEMNKLKNTGTVTEEDFVAANEAFRQDRKTPAVERARKTYIHKLQSLRRANAITQDVYESGMTGLRKPSRTMDKQWEKARKKALATRLSYLEKLYKEGRISEASLRRLKPAVSDFSIYHSVPYLLNINLEGEWVKGKRAKAMQKELRQKLLEALRMLEPEHFRNLHFYEPLQVFAGVEEVLNMAEKKFAYPDKSVDWPSLHKSLHMIARGDAYPEFRKKWRYGQAKWRKIRPRLDQRWEAIRQMAFHPSKEDFNVIEDIMKKAVERGGKADAYLIDACYFPLSYNMKLIGKKQRKRLGILLKQALELGKEKGLKKFPVYGASTVELMSQLDLEEGRRIREEQHRKAEESRQKKEAAIKARRQADTRER